jgi:hypothetical protein
MRAFLIGLIVLLLAASAHATGIHARLVRASNEASLTDERLTEIEPKLREQFGYKHYRQLGTDRARLKLDTMERLDLGEGFTLFVTLKGTDKGQHTVLLEWYSGKAVLVRATVKIGNHRHLFIKGPGVGAEMIALAVTVHE